MSQLAGSTPWAIPALDVHPDDVVAGSYRVVRILGRSRGLLLEARHTEFDQRVVVRLIARDVTTPTVLERFRREMRTLSRLESEHVARILDVGEHVDGSLFLVREHVSGARLDEVVKQRGAMPLQQAVLLLLQLAEAVQEAHSHQIILRDLQPSHVMLHRSRGGDERAKLIDFGMAKLLEETGGSEHTVVMGVDPYASPERLRAPETADIRSDVWSLGCVFYQMLTGVAPFRGEATALMVSIAKGATVPVSRYRPELPQQVDNIVGWALAKRMEDRFGSVYGLAHALLPHACTQGRVLVERIGRLAHIADMTAARRRDRTMRMTAPPSRPSGRVLARRPAPNLEPPPTPSSRSSHPPAPPSRPSYPAAASARPSYPAAASSHPSYPPRQSHPSLPPASTSLPALTQHPRIASARERQLGPLGFAAVVLSLVLVPTLVFATLITMDEAPAAVEARPAASIAAEPHATRAAPPQQEQAEPTPAPAAPTVEPAAALPAPAAPRQIAAPPARPSRPRAPPPQASKATASTAREANEDEAPPARDAKLVVVVLGGKCALSIDGKSMGNRASASAPVAPGTHSVTCSPRGKRTQSRSVSVKPGGRGIATFRL